MTTTTVHPTINYLVTPTLLDSFEFAKNAPPSWKERALKGFIETIKREKPKPPLWVSKGIDFENAVQTACSKAKLKSQKEIKEGSEWFRIVCNKCLGGTFQGVVKKEVVRDNKNLVFYGKTDVSFPERIIDIKTTLNWKGEEKYLRGWQHLFYLWITKKEYFEYLVVVWESETSNVIQRVELVPYMIFCANSKLLEQKIFDAVDEMIAFIHELDLYQDYLFTFSNNM